MAGLQETHQVANGARTGQLAEPGRRFLAWLLDTAIVGATAVTLDPFRFSGSPSGLQVLVWLGAGTLLAFIYLALFDGGPKGATPGKRCVGIRAVDAETGGAIGYGRGLIRRLVYFGGGLCLFMGWLWIFKGSQRQAWHDMAAKTVVVRTRWM